MRFSCGQGRQRRRRGRLQRQKRRMGGRVLEVEWGLGDTLGEQGVTFISYTEWLVKMQGEARGLVLSRRRNMPTSGHRRFPRGRCGSVSCFQRREHEELRIP